MAILFYIIFLLEVTSYSKLVTGSYQKVKQQEVCSRTVAPTSTNNRCLYNCAQCLDVELPYSSIALPTQIPGLSFTSNHDVQNFLNRWKDVQQFVGPECWAILRVVLCSNLMPNCTEHNSTGKIEKVSRPNVDICNDLTKNKCRFIGRHYEWLPLFNCKDTNLYQTNCSNDLREIKLNIKSSSCSYPLVTSNDEASWFKDIKGCALHCKYPVLNTEHQATLSRLIAVLTSIGILLTLLAMPLLVNTTSKGKTSKMANVMFVCTIFHLINYTGWSLQFLLSSPISCNSSGGSLRGLPLVFSLCFLSALMTYLSTLASLLLTACLVRLCYDKIQVSNDRRSNEDEASSIIVIFLYVTATAALIFIVAAIFGKIDGHGLYGICTVGAQSFYTRVIFTVIPKISATVCANMYFSKVILKLSQSKSMGPCLKNILLRKLRCMTMLVVLLNLEILFSVWTYTYDFLNNDQWNEQVDQYVGCSLNLHDLYDLEPKSCVQPTRPQIWDHYMELLTMLSQGMVVATWAFSKDNFRQLIMKLNDMMEDKRITQRRRSFQEVDVPDIEDDGSHNGELQMALMQAQTCDRLQSETPTSLDSVSIHMTRSHSIRSLSNSKFGRFNRKRQGSYTSRDVVDPRLITLYISQQVMSDPGWITHWISQQVMSDPNFLKQHVDYLLWLAKRKNLLDTDYRVNNDFSLRPNQDSDSAANSIGKDDLVNLGRPDMISDDEVEKPGSFIHGSEKFDPSFDYTS